MNPDLKTLMVPKEKGAPKYLFFGGKGGVGKTTLATTTAVWFADRGYRTTIVSTDPTVSLSAVFDQQIGGREIVPIKQVKNLCGININPRDAQGSFQQRFSGTINQFTGAFGNDVISTPCIEEMATFDQFVNFLNTPDSDVIVFDTAPTGKTLRELAMPFDWATFIQKQIQQGQKLAELIDTGPGAVEELERDKKRYEDALGVMRNRSSTVFTLVLLAERLPIEETHSAITGLSQLSIPVQALVINQVIMPEVIEGNRFLAARSRLQSGYLNEIDTRFSELMRARLPLLDRDVSSVAAMREVGQLLYGK
jgi:arsenite-transporting ATPase